MFSIERFLPKKLDENKQTQQLLLRKVLRHPGFSPEEIGLLVAALKEKQEKTNVTLTNREISLLRNHIPYLKEEGRVNSATVLKLSEFLRDQSELIRYKDEIQAPTLGQRLANVRKYFSDLDFHKATLLSLKVCVGTLGGSFILGGLSADVYLVSHVSQLGLGWWTAPAVLGVTVFSGTMGAMLIDGASMISENF